MGRNKYPEQTREHILTLSANLFIENGYDKTSIQDIIDAIGMSKGAIYHHFKSKEEILEAVLEKRSTYTTQMFSNLIDNTQACNAKEKLIRILEQILDDKDIQSINSILSAQIKNSQFVVTGIKDCVIKDAPKIADIMLEGKEDGSITTDFPNECAEVFLLLLNIWINPVIFERTLLETANRLKFLQEMMKQLGVDIVSDKLIQKAIKLFSNMGGNDENI